MATLHEVETYLVELALARKWISPEDLVRAAAFRQKQTDQGRKTTILKVMRPFVPHPVYLKLEAAWNKALRSETLPKVSSRSWGDSSREGE
jgi:hypothetical protein